MCSSDLEMEAYADPAYIEVIKGLEAAVQAEEGLRWALTACQARIDVYRTESANNRTMDKVTM